MFIAVLFYFTASFCVTWFYVGFLDDALPCAMSACFTLPYFSLCYGIVLQVILQIATPHHHRKAAKAQQIKRHCHNKGVVACSHEMFQKTKFFAGRQRAVKIHSMLY